MAGAPYQSDFSQEFLGGGEATLGEDTTDTGMAMRIRANDMDVGGAKGRCEVCEEAASTGMHALGCRGSPGGRDAAAKMAIALRQAAATAPEVEDAPPNDDAEEVWREAMRRSETQAGRQ